MQTKLYSIDGKETGTVELDDAVFGLPVNDDVIYYAYTCILARGLEWRPQNITNTNEIYQFVNGSKAYN